MRKMLVVLWASLSGCSFIRVEVVPLVSEQYTETGRPIEVITTSTNRRYKEIAVIRLDQSGPGDLKECIERAKREAAKLGADAIIITSNTAYSDSGSGVGMGMGGMGMTGGVGMGGGVMLGGGSTPHTLLVVTAIVFQEQSEAVVPERPGDEPLLGASLREDGAFLGTYRCDGSAPQKGEAIKVFPTDKDPGGVLVQTKAGGRQRVPEQCVERQAGRAATP